MIDSDLCIDCHVCGWNCPVAMLSFLGLQLGFGQCIRPDGTPLANRELEFQVYRKVSGRSLLLPSEVLEGMGLDEASQAPSEEELCHQQTLATDERGIPGSPAPRSAGTPHRKRGGSR